MQKVKVAEVTRFVTDCMMAAGTPREAAQQLAGLLVAADSCGIRSHGINRLKTIDIIASLEDLEQLFNSRMAEYENKLRNASSGSEPTPDITALSQRYILDIKAGRCEPCNKPEIVKETAATAWVNGNNVLGATAAHFCTDLAVKKAKETGIACISVKGSNHFGIGGYWSKRMADNGMIGMTFTNGSPLVAPTRSTKAAIGTNPLAVVAPGLPSTGPFYLDISMATVALGKIEMCRRSRTKLGRGWAQGPDGKETFDPDTAIKGGSLLPLGGCEKTAGYKGFGLAALVDMLSGVLAGAKYGYHVPRWSPTTKEAAAIGQTFIAINHKCFACGFEERVSDCIEFWRKMKPADPKLPVLAPGDLEKKALAEAESTGEIRYITAMLDSCDRLAKVLKVKPMKREEVCEMICMLHHGDARLLRQASQGVKGQTHEKGRGV